MKKIVAVYGSPRRKGNTSTLLSRAVAGAREEGAEVVEFVLRDLKISPCLEIYGCKKDGRCVIRDDFHVLADAVFSADALMLASPVFFYAVSAHTKAFMDRCQSLWVKKYWIENAARRPKTRQALFIAAGATQGKKLFDGILLSVRYFLDVFDAELTGTLLYRGLEDEGDAAAQPQILAQAFQAGRDLALGRMQDRGPGSAP
ncbi:MAG: flavodoxin family protein [Thermodesulfobacteriota bacterium]